MVLTQTQLIELDRSVRVALEQRDNSGLNLIGFGEISVAIGFPKQNPLFVCKPTPPSTQAELDAFSQLLEDYAVALDELGAAAVETVVMAADRGDYKIGYQIQPLLPKETLGERVLAEAEPDAEHPFLVGLAEIIARTNSRVSVDAQVTNWSWDGNTATMLDLGTPFMWDASGELILDADSMFTSMPAPIRGLAKKDILKLAERWKQPRGVAADVVANLIRIDLEEWVPPTLAIFNRILDPAEPLNEAEARASLAEDAKAFPRLKKLQRAQRFWAERVRRQPYDFFIQPTLLSDVDRS